MQIIQLIQDPSLAKKYILEKLICHSTGMSKAELLTHTENELTVAQVDRIKASYHKYVEEKMPLEYILWYVEFLGVQFSVTPDTLIPRPETEYMLQAVNEYVQAAGQQFNILDIGTWCGVLWLSSMYHNPGLISAAILAELSPDALEVAKGNYKKLFGESPPTPLWQRGEKELDEEEDKYWMHHTSELQKDGLIWRGWHLPYNPALKERARDLRKNMTAAEKKLRYDYFTVDSQFTNKIPPTPLVKGGNSEWNEEWGDKRVRVLRQHPIDNFIVDFYIASAKLVIEVDGDTHDLDTLHWYDQKRTDTLQSYGLQVIRFTNDDVLNNFDEVCNSINTILETKAPLGKGGDDPLCGSLGDINISFLLSNLLDHPDIYALLASGPTVLVANLPYIPEQMFDENVEDNVKKREPRMAFVWGDDGNDLYRIMFDQLLAQVPDAQVTMFLEMMTRQVDILRQEYGEKIHFEEVKTFHFNIRIVKATTRYR